jgi:hypothetical protein
MAVQRYGAFLGALVAAPTSPAAGLGIPVSNLTLALMVFPAMCDWYLNWCQSRRGFFANTERSVLYEIRSQVRQSTGWLRQHPGLANRVKPVAGLVSAKDVQQARENWSLVCESCFHHISGRLAELNGVTRTHRDQTIAIMPVLSAQSPLAEYRKITDEILKQMPNERQEPLEYSLAVRAYLVFRVAVHLGIRQRNLRELLICPPGQKYRRASELEELRRGEMRWNPDVMEWRVFIPALAFKNSRSTFFKEKSFHMALPNLQGLYKWVNRYIRVDRPRLLKDAVDPETFSCEMSWKQIARILNLEGVPFSVCGVG